MILTVLQLSIMIVVSQYIGGVNVVAEVKTCPYCGGTEFGKGRQMAQGNVLPLKGILKGAFNTGTPLYHMICLSCGSVVRSYVEKSDKFKPTT